MELIRIQYFFHSVLRLACLCCSQHPSLCSLKQVSHCLCFRTLVGSVALPVALAQDGFLCAIGSVAQAQRSTLPLAAVKKTKKPHFRNTIAVITGSTCLVYRPPKLVPPRLNFGPAHCHCQLNFNLKSFYIYCLGIFFCYSKYHNSTYLDEIQLTMDGRGAF